MAKQDYKKISEKMALVAGVLQPMMTIPQVWKIYTAQSAEGVSLITWVGFAVFGLVFLVYGIIHNLKPIWITQIIWFSLQIMVVIGILMYG